MVVCSRISSESSFLRGRTLTQCCSCRLLAHPSLPAREMWRGPGCCRVVCCTCARWYSCLWWLEKQLLQLLLLQGRSHFPSSEDQTKTCNNILFVWASFQKLYLSFNKLDFYSELHTEGQTYSEKRLLSRSGRLWVTKRNFIQFPAFFLFHRCFNML